ncbi:iron donor protein CyaY [Candidatus Pandoraea novymonadis]|uniref:Iron-sulfur cluster assembly protein CyaY n=1 Tax=Candidatus Pandoraea novymonadis TaxID=1808959 RepID=A0ABX5FCN1_9BURK|nr:iron donor protein CyaY [Candidatus Pandoraea novymonadis]PSB91555.1 Protein CyaY [Candidatus Pandoraea novymonadis]
MTESEFLSMGEAVLAKVEVGLETSGADVDCERTGNVLTLTFDGGSKIIINLQTVMREIWVASCSGAFHYRFCDDRWYDTRDGSEFFQALSGFATEHADRAVMLNSF